MTEKKIGDIQVLRAVAIILVLLQHLSLTPALYNQLPNHGTMPFWAGVELFFVISGLVVTQSVFARSLEPLSFFLRRLFRLWPAILFFLAISAVVLWLAAFCPPDTWGRTYLSTTPSIFIREAIATLGGFYINIPGKLYTNGQIWSLAVEFQFYVAYTVWIFVCARFSANLETVRRATIVLALTLYALALTRRVGLLVNSSVLDIFPINYIVGWRFDFLLIGVIISATTFRARPAGPVIAITALLAPLIVTSMSEAILEPGPKPFLDGLAYPVMGLCFGLLCLLAKYDNAFPAPRGRLYAALCWIGDRSYSIYLLHFPVMALQWLVFYRFLPSAFATPVVYGFSQALFVVPVTLILSDISFRFVETPGRDIGRYLLANLRKSSAVSTQNA